MSIRKSISHNLLMAITGWIASVIGIIAFGLAYTVIFPAIVRPEHYYGPGPGFPLLLGLAILAGTPGGLLGGIIGGRISVEGGKWSQRILASIFGIGMALPCSCYSLWVFTGF
jgi:hypothetical protein